MASTTTVQDTGPDSFESLLEDRQKMWSGFTAAIAGLVAFVVILLIGMAVFLL
ncbi:hypothetical protein [Rhodopila globiformis]|uniref:hypothetical protein n=1 Tax=Rhodopila globiformis TaxID=1071 RepID=UPI001304C5C0|nr:hypothetical protein [Rhodopila globiformis]